MVQESAELMPYQKWETFLIRRNVETNKIERRNPDPKSSGWIPAPDITIRKPPMFRMTRPGLNGRKDWVRTFVNEDTLNYAMRNTQWRNAKGDLCWEDRDTVSKYIQGLRENNELHFHGFIIERIF